MPVCQYRKGGGGDILLYRRYEIPNSVPLIGGWGFWRKVMNVSSEKTHVSNKMMDKFDDVVSLVRTIERLTTEEKHINDLIKKGRQDNSNFSDPLEIPIPKNASQFKSRLGDPRDGWNRVVTFVRDWYGPSTPPDVMARNATVSNSTTADRVGVIKQPVGEPIPMGRNNKGPNQNRQPDSW